MDSAIITIEYSDYDVCKLLNFLINGIIDKSIIEWSKTSKTNLTGSESKDITDTYSITLPNNNYEESKRIEEGISVTVVYKTSISGNKGTIEYSLNITDKTKDNLYYKIDNDSLNRSKYNTDTVPVLLKNLRDMLETYIFGESIKEKEIKERMNEIVDYTPPEPEPEVPEIIDDTSTSSGS